MPKSAHLPDPVEADLEPLEANRMLASRILPPGDRIDRARVTVNLAETPLAWLARRGHISARQLRAGCRLRDDFHADRKSVV